MTVEAVVQILGDVPKALVRDFLQHVRSFDAAHPGCHFRMSVVSNTDETGQEIAQMLQSLDPPIPVIAVISRNV